MNFEKKESSFISSNGIDRIYYYVCTPKPELGKPKAVVQICHGMCERFGNYEEFIDCLCQNGYAVIGNDCLGHGKSVSDKSELGFFALRYGWIYLVKDARTVTNAANRLFPDMPVLMTGHSMGSLIVMAYLSRYSCEVKAAVLLGTVGKHIGTAAGIMLADAEIYLYGEMYRSKTISRLLYNLGNIKITDSHTDLDWTSRNDKIVAKHIADENYNFIFTAAGYRDVFMLAEYCASEKWFDRVRCDIPLLLACGTDDPVGSFGRGVMKLYERLIRHGFTDAELKLYDGSRHELLNEINRSEVFEDIIYWLDKKLEQTECDNT